MTSYIGLYANRELTTPLEHKLVKGKRVWVLNFGHLDAGESRTFMVFLENQSLGDIENLKINVIPIKKEGVQVEVYRGHVYRLRMNDIHEFHVRWVILEDARAGKCQATIEINGIITEE